MTTKQTTTKKTPLKRLISIIAIAIMLFALAIPCFAYQGTPIWPGGSLSVNNQFYYLDSNNEIVIYGVRYSSDTTKCFISIDTTKVNLIEIYSNDRWHTSFTFSRASNAPDEATCYEIISEFVDASYALMSDDFETTYNEGYTEGYEIGQQDGYNWGYDIGEENGYLQGVEVSYDVGYNNGYADGHAQGETDGLNTAETGKNLILTIFSVPTYVLSNVFNFEIFGINLYSLICFLLTISIVGIVLKKIL